MWEKFCAGDKVLTVVSMDIAIAATILFAFVMCK